MAASSNESLKSEISDLLETYDYDYKVDVCNFCSPSIVKDKVKTYKELFGELPDSLKGSFLKGIHRRILPEIDENDMNDSSGINDSTLPPCPEFKDALELIHLYEQEYNEKTPRGELGGTLLESLEQEIKVNGMDHPANYDMIIQGLEVYKELTGELPKDKKWRTILLDSFGYAGSWFDTHEGIRAIKLHKEMTGRKFPDKLSEKFGKIWLNHLESTYEEVAREIGEMIEGAKLYKELTGKEFPRDMNKFGSTKPGKQ